MSESQIKKSLREMYELGVEHGRKLAKREIKIEQLEKEIVELAEGKQRTKRKPQKGNIR